MKSRIKNLLKRMHKGLLRTRYTARVLNEIRFYRNCEQVHDLPEIFHYWSNQYLLPMQQPFGFSNPDAFFVHYAVQRFQEKPDQALRIVSVGSGNGELEVRVAESLKAAGARDFVLECIDINTHMLKRTRQLAQEKGVDTHIQVTKADFNQWQPEADRYDIVMANQSLHHVLNLEGLFDAIKASMKEDGSFITSDMIGRNGHQRWPEALELLKPFWEELPRAYRYNQLLKREELEYINHDCSDSGFEGIRAQDILPLLVEHFHFELFIPFANIIMVFIDRPFGHNFDAEAAWDRDFIDRVHQADETAILDGRIKPTQMIAAMKKTPVGETRLRHPRLTPAFCIRETGGNH